MKYEITEDEYQHILNRRARKEADTILDEKRAACPHTSISVLGYHHNKTVYGCSNCGKLIFEREI